ncbi:MAG: bifunctional adenosylcobinamide kinase/adenosylcobinamide-phosphate guanylyltransferase [Anaerolineales bacterium]|nr:bifunctional adenosylcobinamide kinase/adenosylcobinamide-phosphate guanylyltransferase [Chloroflexota bacterium]MBL6982922.1 bifunctional adenosylcobinamide kinase/adenosylcobinamide-phosphate guanylyltransferase [Anaerolineales bacterium]
MGKLTFLIGGARSGKSTYAEKMASKHGGRVLYIATAQALDPEMAERIEKHKEQRPESWQTREIPYDIAAAIQDELGQTDIVLLDCLTMLVSNLILTVTDKEFEPDETRAAKIVDEEIKAMLDVFHQSDTDWIIVSNEVGMGLVPPYPLGRVYRDLLGWTNRKVAEAADEVLLLVAGMMLPLHELGISFEG